jgi:guanyl-specific ribonuclease Sa
MNTISNMSLPDDLRRAIIEATTAVKMGRSLTVHWNLQGYLPSAEKGQYYVEYDVGIDREGGRGARRIVLLVGPKKSPHLPSAVIPQRQKREDGTYRYRTDQPDHGGARRIWRVFFSDQHYNAGSWYEVTGY